MLSQKPPIRVVAPGRTYRCDSDATHTPMFHQLEALVIDEDTNLGHLKWVVEQFCVAHSSKWRKSRCGHGRPSFRSRSRAWNGTSTATAPAARSNSAIGNDWLELGGSGMVHPRVLEMCGIDPERYQGFAFGFGLDRMAMLKYGAPDLARSSNPICAGCGISAFAALDLPTLDGGLSR